MLTTLAIVFAILVLAAMPLAFAIGIASMAAIASVSGGPPLLLIPQTMVSGIDSFVLLALPLFILAGELMERGGMSRRLIDFATSLIGHIRGGLGQVSVVSEMIFSGLSGSGLADASALGAILIPAMIRRGYAPGFVASLMASCATIGPIIPPSTLMIIYGSITSVSVGAMFLGGILPGVLIGLAIMVVVDRYAAAHGHAGEPRASTQKVLVDLRKGAWALVAPGIIVGGIAGGVFTPTEAGAVAVVYAFLVGTLVHRDLDIREIVAALRRSVAITGAVMLVVATSLVFSRILALERVPITVANSMLSLSRDPAVIMLIIVALLLVLGMFVEVLAAALIVVPVLAPVASIIGYNDVHFAVVVVITLAIGGVTPPVGLLLFVTCGIADVPLSKAVPYVWPFLAIMTLVLLLIAFVPETVLFVPRLIYPQL